MYFHRITKIASINQKYLKRNTDISYLHLFDQICTFLVALKKVVITEPFVKSLIQKTGCIFDKKGADLTI